MNLRKSSDPETTLETEQSTFDFISLEDHLSNCTNSCSVTALHFSRTKIRVLMAAMAVAKLGSFCRISSNRDATLTPFGKKNDEIDSKFKKWHYLTCVSHERVSTLGRNLAIALHFQSLKYVGQRSPKALLIQQPLKEFK